MLVACGGGGAEQTAIAVSANLLWDPVSAPYVSSHRIYYGTAPGIDKDDPSTYDQQINVGKSSTYAFTGLSSGTRYYFVVTSIDSGGNESAVSREMFKDIP